MGRTLDVPKSVSEISGVSPDGKIPFYRNIKMNVQINNILTDIGNDIVKKINKNCPTDIYLKRLSWDLTYRDKIGNTHSCPKSGVQNWGQSPDKPQTYPGWQGRLWLIFNKSSPGFGSDYTNNTGIHPGTGGYGFYDLAKIGGLDYDNCYPMSWDCILWEDDYPELKQARKLAYTEDDAKFKEAQLANLLTDQVPMYKPKFKLTDHFTYLIGEENAHNK